MKRLYQQILGTFCHDSSWDPDHDGYPKPIKARDEFLTLHHKHSNINKLQKPTHKIKESNK